MVTEVYRENRMGIRQLLEKHLEDLYPKMALEFSGGTDSNCLLLSLLSMGYRPSLYTYKLEGTESEDVKRAEYVADRFGLDLTICEIPYDFETLVKDIKTLISMGIFGIVAIQVSHGHLYTSKAIKEPLILNGGGPDEFLGSYKDFALNGSTKNKDIFDAFRRKKFAEPDFASRISLRKIHWGREVYLPYIETDILDYALQFSWEEINKPIRKGLLLKDYPEMREYPDEYFPKRGNQYFIAGVKEFHNQLLRSSYNRRGYKRIDGVYREIKREMEGDYV